MQRLIKYNSKTGSQMEDDNYCPPTLQREPLSQFQYKIMDAEASYFCNISLMITIWNFTLSP